MLDARVVILSVPADDPATREVEGGRPGDTVVFTIGGLRAGQTATWRGGTNTRLDLTATSARLFLPLVSRMGARGSSWELGGTQGN